MRTVLILLLIISSAALFAQTDVLEAIKNSHDCDDELRKINNDITGLNAEYKQTVEDLQNGLFCSRCNRSKTEIQKTGEEFYKHVDRVEGKVQRAPQEAFDKAKEEYLSKYNSFVSQYKIKQADCDNLRKEMDKKYQESLNENVRKQQQAAAEKYAELVEAARKRNEDLKEQTNRLMQSVNEVLERLKQNAANKTFELKKKTERFWDSNKEDLKALGKEYVEKQLEPVTDEIDETKRNFKESLAVTNQTWSSIETIEGVNDAATTLYTKNLELFDNNDDPEKNEAQAEENFKAFERTTLLEFAKAPYPVRRAFKVYEKAKDKVYKVKEKVLIIKRLTTSAIKIYFFDE